MRIRSKSICLLLFVAITASGSGNILASAICMHTAEMQNAANRAEDHSCCPAGHAIQETHCNTASDQPDNVSPEARLEQAYVDAAIPDESSLQVIQPCGHCLVQSIPTPAYVSLREKSQTRRVADARPSDASHSHIARQMSFKLPVTSRQGAPPGSPTLDHILLNIFLI